MHIYPIFCFMCDTQEHTVSHITTAPLTVSVQCSMGQAALVCMVHSALECCLLQLSSWSLLGHTGGPQLLQLECESVSH